MTIDELRHRISMLSTMCGEDVECGLKGIMNDFLRNFHIEVDGWNIVPTEVEAYYFHLCHMDTFVHQVKQQCNNFGHLYVHRRTSDSVSPKGRCGIDMCLSDRGDFYFGILLRSAYINGEPVCGPHNIYLHLCRGDNGYFKILEEDFSLVANDNEACGHIFHSLRIGLRNEPEKDTFYREQLRTVIAPSLRNGEDFAFKPKEELFWGREPDDKEAGDAIMMLGYKPKIRPAGPDDIPLIRSIAEKAFRETYMYILSPEQIDFMMEWMYSEESLRRQMQEEGNAFFLYEDKGYVSIRPDGYRQDRSLFHLEKLYVPQQYQRKGIGRKLLWKAIAYAKMYSVGVPIVELNVNRNNPAVGFYEKNGFSIEREVDNPIGQGFFMNDYIMAIDFMPRKL